MTAELALALILLMVVVAFLSGEMYGRQQERQRTRRRVDKIRRTYQVGGIREW
jgi:lipopolysaccharide biosynthesis regulator YciM